MIKLEEFAATAVVHLEAADVLLVAGLWQMAAYHCGYAVEIKLKVRAARRRGMTSFPERSHEFVGDSRALRTHDLDALLDLSGAERLVKGKFFVQWNQIAIWAPEHRYAPLGSVDEQAARDIVSAASLLVQII